VTDSRLARPSPRHGKPRFRCLVCRVFVTGTDLGQCPRCGWTPPDLTRVPEARTNADRWWTSGRFWLAVAALVAAGALGWMSR